MWGSDVRKASRRPERTRFTDGTKRGATWGAETAQHRRMVTREDARSALQRAQAVAGKALRKGKKK